MAKAGRISLPSPCQRGPSRRGHESHRGRPDRANHARSRGAIWAEVRTGASSLGEHVHQPRLIGEWHHGAVCADDGLVCNA